MLSVNVTMAELLHLQHSESFEGGLAQGADFCREIAADNRVNAPGRERELPAAFVYPVVAKGFVTSRPPALRSLTSCRERGKFAIRPLSAPDRPKILALSG